MAGEFSAPSPGRWTSPPHFDSTRLRYQWLVWAIPVGTWLFSPANFVLFGIAVASVPATIVLTVLREARKRKLSVADRGFSDRPDDPDEVSVEMVLRVDDRMLGADRGLLWFNEGLMSFVGHATSFRLALQDFQPQPGPGLPAGEWDGDNRTWLRLRVPSRHVVVQIFPLDGQGARCNRLMEQFFRSGVYVEGERQWPPLEPYDREGKEVRDVRRA